MSNTERLLENSLSERGIYFRTQEQRLPGTPDIVIQDLRIVVFVHGCYWHRHLDCGAARMPRTNVVEWAERFRGNVQRDATVYKSLEADGWWIFIAWECDINRNLAEVADLILDHMERRLQNFKLGGGQLLA